MAKFRERVYLPNGQTKWASGNSTKELIASVVKIVNGTSVSSVPFHSPTLKEFVCDTYWPTFVANLEATTQHNYDFALRLNILPFMGDMPLNEITVVTIQQFYDWMATGKQHGHKKNLNRKTIERVSGLLGKIFRVAVELGLIDKSPIKKALLKNNGERAHHHKPLTENDIDSVKKQIPSLSNKRERLFMALLAYMGMRPEEILGLRWENVYLDEGYCEMIRTVTYPDNKNTVIKERGKTEESIRTIIIPDPVIHILQQVVDKMGYVVHGKSKDVPCSCSTYRRMYKDAFEQLGIKGKYTPYDFRTTFGTTLCELGLTTKQVADMMGHTDTRMVETVYALNRHSGIMKNKNILNEINKEYVV